MGARSIYACALLTLLVFSSFAQQLDIRERLYLHLNSQTLISGETLYFSAFNLSDKTGKLTDMSKILYVQLIGRSGPVFQKKIPLTGGTGSGDFFINSLIATGNYQLVAYTQWMKNFDDQLRLPVLIINPFEPYPSEQPLSGKVSFSLIIPHEKIVAGIENQIGYRLTDGYGKPLRLEGRIMDGNGHSVLSFSKAEHGMGHFLFTPKPETDYKVIVEGDQESFHFFDLPRPVMRGASLVLTERQAAWQVHIHSTLTHDTPLTLRLTSMQEEIHKQTVYKGTLVSLQKTNLQEGLHRLELYNGTELLTTRWLVHSTQKKLQTDTMDYVYGNRDQVKTDLDLPPGEYSISVRKMNDHIGERMAHAMDNLFWFNLLNIENAHCTHDNVLTGNTHQFRTPANIPETVALLPECRNEIIQGSVTDSTGQPVSSATVTLSIPGKPFQLKTALTNETGKFSIHFKSPVRKSTAYLTTLNTAEKMQIRIENKFLSTAPPFDYNVPALDSAQLAEVVAKSIRVQLENTFFQKPPTTSDTVLSNPWMPQLTEFDFHYPLDDYNRFPALKDYFVEYIACATIQKDRIRIRQNLYRPDFNKSQLIVLDGVPVDAGKILSLNPYEVKTIGVISNRYFLGPSIFDGVMSIETYEGSMGGYTPAVSLKTELIGLSVPPAGHPLTHGYRKGDPRPDKRDQLYWKPVAKKGGQPYPLSFYTSDVDGLFMIRVEGFSSEGKAITIKRAFRVE